MVAVLYACWRRTRQARAVLPKRRQRGTAAPGVASSCWVESSENRLTATDQATESCIKCHSCYDFSNRISFQRISPLTPAFERGVEPPSLELAPSLDDSCFLVSMGCILSLVYGYVCGKCIASRNMICAIYVLKCKKQCTCI